MRRRSIPYAAMACGALALVGLGSLAAPQARASGEEAYLQRFAGQWSASGKVRENAQASNRQVSCALEGSSSDTGAAIRGTCRALGIFTRDISVELRFEPQTGRYSGVYNGSPAGPVQLSGTRSGNVLTLDATWPKEINGDRAATMIIRNPQPGRFTFLVVDRVEDGGPIETMTNLTVAAL
ncbi:hypothetical protein [Microbaculum marinum]|uniref:DUF1579 domain-containing protein n=1 Tax=Microbaculum marinum TaxID=1764581 RepID=A0AAW9RQP3_9HYPH